MKSTLARPELWLLAAASIGLWLWSRAPEPEPIEPQRAPLNASQPALTLDRCSLTRDYGNARLDLEITYHNSSPRPLILSPTVARLLDARGREVPAFILPAEKPPQVAARSRASCQLRFWLEADHLKQDLNLHLEGQQVRVKGPQPLALESLPNQQSRQWRGPITAP